MFNDAFKVISSRKKVDQEYLKYHPDSIKGLTYNQFSRVCDCVFHVLEDEAKQLSGEFPHYVIKYQGIRFNLMTLTERVLKSEKQFRSF